MNAHMKILNIIDSLKELINGIDKYYSIYSTNKTNLNSLIEGINTCCEFIEVKKILLDDMYDLTIKHINNELLAIEKNIEYISKTIKSLEKNLENSPNPCSPYLWVEEMNEDKSKFQKESD